MTCPVCLEEYKGRTVVKVGCQYCPFTACRGCLQRHMLQSYEDPHCLECKRGWSSEFMAATFPLSFRNDALRKHRRNILLEREKSLLPAMQVFVGLKRDIQKYDAQIKEIRAVYGDPAIRVASEAVEKTLSWRYRVLANKYRRLKHRRDAITIQLTKVPNDLTPAQMGELRREREEMKGELNRLEGPYDAMRKEFNEMGQELNTAIRNYWVTTHAYEGNDRAPIQRREFIMKCSDTECRGFLSSAYKCGTCEKWTCPDCLLTIGLDKEAEHTCNPDTVETAKTIKADTRPCPKCGTRIFKIDGCDQMYCVMEGCHTAFSWNSGHIATGRIHNPHYYEWLKRTGGGTAEREPGDIPCGGLPNIHQIIDVMRNNDIPSGVKQTIFDTHRALRELIDMRLADFPARPTQLANKELNVQYLMNKITETEWKRQLEISETKFQRKKEIGQILQTVATAGADAMNSIVNEADRVEDDVFAVWVSTTGVETLEQLRQFGNESLKGLAKRDRIAVPQFGDSWAWKPLRAIYKPGKPVADATA